jgi:hypothetical protein
MVTTDQSPANEHVKETMAEATERQKENARKTSNRIFLSMALVFAVFAVCALGGYFYAEYNATNLRAQNIALTVQLNSHSEALDEAEKVRIDLQRCLEENDDDPFKRRALDLERYITTQYPGVPRELAEVIAVQLDRQCADQDIPFVLAVGLMEIESRFNPFAKSHVGARGLLQVMPTVWMGELSNEFGVKDDRELNGIEMGIKSGLYVLKKYIEKNNGNITFALKNYNGTKGDEFHTSVYEKAGRFAIFRSRIQNIDKLEVSKKENEGTKSSG